MGSTDDRPAGSEERAAGRERRDFPRISKRCLVELHSVDLDDAVFAGADRSAGMLQNISGGGVCIELEAALPLGTKLALKIHLPQIRTPVIALGRVVWLTALDPGGQDTGIEFWWVGWEDPSAQEQIRDFITRQLKSSDPG